MHISRTSVEVGDNSRDIHRECIRTRQLFHTVGHLTQGLRPTGSRICHQQDFQPHSTIIFRNGHSRVHRRFTGSHRHVRGIGNNDSTFHQLTSCMRIYQFGELRKDFHHLIRTFTTSSDNYDIRFRLLGDGMLKHCFPCTERTGNKSRSPLYNGVNRINNTDTGFQ